MMKKLKVFIMLMLMTTSIGWTQSSDSIPKWTVWEHNKDTIITYNFNKPDLLGLRLLVTGLEKTKDLYDIELKASIHKDSLILVKDQYILNRDSVIIEHTKFIEFQRKENNRLEALNKEIEKAYKKQKILTPIIAGGSVAITLAVCYLLVK